MERIFKNGPARQQEFQLCKVSPTAKREAAKRLGAKGKLPANSNTKITI